MTINGNEGLAEGLNDFFDFKKAYKKRSIAGLWSLKLILAV